MKNEIFKNETQLVSRIAWHRASGTWNLTGFPELYSNGHLILMFSPFLSTTKLFEANQTAQKL